jgi:Sulfotransferase domain
MLDHYVRGEYHIKWFDSYIENRFLVKNYLIKYEDMLMGPQSLSDFRSMPVGKIFSAYSDIDNSFEKLSDGRRVGQEDRSHHYRKGIIGDWHNYLTEEQNLVCQKSYHMAEIGYR